MTLHYFPAIYPDELLYSVLARYQKHLGEPPQTQTNKELLGKGLVISSLDLQSGINHLTSLLNNSTCVTAEYILDELTTFNYLVAYSSPRLASKVRSEVLAGNVRDWYVRLGYAAFKVDRVTVLRFCMKCRDMMMKEYGELYWRRTHQLPSALICLEHQISLSKSLVNLKLVGRHTFIAASQYNCPEDAESLIPVKQLDSQSIKCLKDLAQLSEYLLKPSFQKKTLGGWTSHYRRQLEDMGFSTENGTVNLQRLHTGVASLYEGCMNYLLGMELNPSLPWLTKLSRKQRSLSHPFHHLLLQCYLKQLTPQQEKPFGKGPWECRNPLAKHYTKKVIGTYRMHDNHGHRVAVFECKCGYKYTRWYFPSTGKIGPARFQSFGNSLEPAIISALQNGTSLRALARCLQLDPKTVVRLSSSLGIEVSWKNSTYIKRTIPKYSMVHIVNQTNRAKRIVLSKFDWVSIDIELKKTLKQTVRNIKKVKPPVKITLAEVERQINRSGWISKRFDKLPLTKAYLDGVLETHISYRKRRIDWAIDEIRATGSSMFISSVMRKAGLRMDAHYLVELALKKSFDIRNVK